MPTAKNNPAGERPNITWELIDCNEPNSLIDLDQSRANIQAVLENEGASRKKFRRVSQQLRGKPSAPCELHSRGDNADGRYSVSDPRLEAITAAVVMLYEIDPDGSYRYFPNERDEEGNRSLAHQLLRELVRSSPWNEECNSLSSRSISQKLAILEREGIIKRYHRKYHKPDGGFATEVFGRVRLDRIWWLMQNRQGHLESSRDFFRELEESNRQKTNSKD